MRARHHQDRNPISSMEIEHRPKQKFLGIARKTKVLIMLALCVLMFAITFVDLNIFIGSSASTLSFSSPSIMDDDESTGAWANCVQQPKKLTDSSLQDNDSDGKVRSTIVSCRTIPYRIHVPTFKKAGGIIIGVLSGAGGSGPKRRQSIRDTWANRSDYEDQNVKDIGIFFLVAGPWDAIRNEYNKYGDLIWIDEEEVYDGENSVLTYKTQSFIRIVHDMATKFDIDVKYLFKTDDDSYIHLKNLYNILVVQPPGRPKTHQVEEKHPNDKSSSSSSPPAPRDYWGWCQAKKVKPHRDATMYKWPVSYELYPEPMYPRYCQGAGFALSWKFVKCASTKDHISKIRYLPFEDASIGLLAERCDITPTMVEMLRWIHLYRTDLDEERYRVREGLEKIEKSKLTRPVMLNRIVQHRIYDTWDMEQHHKVVMDPKTYNRESKVQWYDIDSNKK